MSYIKQYDLKLFFCKKILTFDLKFYKLRCFLYGKFCTINSYSSTKTGTKLENLTQRSENLPEDLLNNHYFYQYQTILNWINLDDNIQIAIELIKQSDISVGESVITLVVNIVGQILPL